MATSNDTGFPWKHHRGPDLETKRQIHIGFYNIMNVEHALLRYQPIGDNVHLCRLQELVGWMGMRSTFADRQWNVKYTVLSTLKMHHGLIELASEVVSAQMKNFQIFVNVLRFVIGNCYLLNDDDEKQARFR